MKLKEGQAVEYVDNQSKHRVGKVVRIRGKTLTVGVKNSEIFRALGISPPYKKGSYFRKERIKLHQVRKIKVKRSWIIIS